MRCMDASSKKFWKKSKKFLQTLHQVAINPPFMRISIQKAIQMKTTIRSILITVTLLTLGLVPITQAVSPPPDGDYPGGNTAEGFNALFSLSPQDGGFNTAVGFQ